jgi:tetraacyldisaccharide 4'-kinase
MSPVKNNKLIRALLWVPAKLFELAVRTRIAAYETGYLKPKPLGPVVISVGNITLGGTGKTPMAAYIADYLQREGYKVAVLTRGYGRRSNARRVLNSTDASAAGEVSEVGDEPLMLARALPRVQVIVDADRFVAGQWAEREMGSDVLVLDDGYQHLQIKRDLNLLLIDATDPYGNFEMIPFGRLREPLYGLKRADAIIITRADRPFDQGQTSSIIRYFCGEAIPLLYFHSAIVGFRHLKSGQTYDPANFRDWNVATMCAIGNPRAFVDELLQVGMNVYAESFFRDHHSFSQADLDRVISNAREVGADALITTEKDAVRLENLEFGDMPVYAARLELRSDDEVRLKSLLLRTVVRK